MLSTVWTWIAAGMLVGVALIAKIAAAGGVAADWHVLGSGQVAAVLGVFGLAGALLYYVVLLLRTVVGGLFSGRGARDA
jgi:hypothetical protein